MNTLERDIRQFILRALLRAKEQPISDDTLRQMVRGGFAHVAITEADLGQIIKEMETSGIIMGTADDVFGLVWALTLSGKTKAQQLQ